MRNVKPWYLSTGVWGAALSLVGSALALVKPRLDPAALGAARDWVLPLAALVGALLALYGRVRATRRIVLGAAPVDGRLAKQNWRMNAAPLGLALLPVVVAFASGCSSLTSPAAGYVAADRATFEAVAPEYLAYVHADPALDEDARSRRDRTVQTWKERIEAGGRANNDRRDSREPESRTVSVRSAPEARSSGE